MGVNDGAGEKKWHWNSLTPRKTIAPFSILGMTYVDSEKLHRHGSQKTGHGDRFTTVRWRVERILESVIGSI